MDVRDVGLIAQILVGRHVMMDAMPNALVVQFHVLVLVPLIVLLLVLEIVKTVVMEAQLLL